MRACDSDEQSLQKLIKAETGSHMSKHFTVKAPTESSFSSFRSILNQRQLTLFTITFKRGQDASVDLLGQVTSLSPRCLHTSQERSRSNVRHVRHAQQMIYLTSKAILCFVCTPVIASADEYKYALDPHARSLWGGTAT
jgi:hypothetical protein